MVLGKAPISLNGDQQTKLYTQWKTLQTCQSRQNDLRSLTGFRTESNQPDAHYEELADWLLYR